MAEQATAVQAENVDKKQKARQLVEEVVRRVGVTKRREALGAYLVCPGKRFADEQADEEVVLLLRAHPITNIKWVLGTLVFLIVPQLFLITGAFGLIPANFVFIARWAVYLLVLGYAFENFLRWYYSVLIITNERIVDIDFYGVLHRSVAYAALNHIEQPSLHSGGLIRTLWHFGDVEVATAAHVGQVEIRDVPYPDRVLRIISELSEELERRRERGE